MTQPSNPLYHLGALPEQLNPYVILPGDPKRVPKIAALLEQPYLVADQREFCTWNGKLNGVPVTVTSTGIGGPSASIAVEELVQSGAHTLLRVGTCGAIQPDLKVGTLVIPTGAVRKEGTGCSYLPLEFPAVPDYGVVRALEQSAQTLGVPYRLGIVESKDSFYGQHDPESMPVGRMLKEKWKMWEQAGVLASEMECATIFLTAAVRRVRAGAVLLVCNNHAWDRPDQPVEEDFDVGPMLETAVASMKALIGRDAKG